MKRLLPILLLGLSACGNYSNEDLDFQLALPEDGELEAKLPQALTLDDSPEYYKTTRKVVTDFNGLAKVLVGLVDKVRGITPTSRQGTQRTWGPWPDDKHPGWQVRVLMDRVDDASLPTGFAISYNVQVRNTLKAGTDFIDFMTGSYAPSGNARSGQGRLSLLVDNVRVAEYPVDDFGQLAKIELRYQTMTYPITVQMHVENTITAKERAIQYDYQEERDGSGTLFFNVTADRNLGSTDLRFVSRWLGSGAGRADATAVNLGLVVGTDCWGPDTRATLTPWRLTRETPTAPGDSPLCVFGPSTDLVAPPWTP